MPSTTRRPGKRVGGCLYVHKNYARAAGIPERFLSGLRRKNLTVQNVHFQSLTCLRYDPRRPDEIMLQHSPDFNEAHEPQVGVCVTVKVYHNKTFRCLGTNVKIVAPPTDPYVWHHKWLWVADTYRGFDVEAAKLRSESYKKLITPYDRPRIGRLSYWEKFLRREGLEL